VGFLHQHVGSGTYHGYCWEWDLSWVLYILVGQIMIVLQGTVFLKSKIKTASLSDIRGSESSNLRLGRSDIAVIESKYTDQ
jgi:hypothetical protein